MVDIAITWLAAHWVDVGVGFYILDKVVKWTPTKYDDFTVDVVKDIIRKIAGKPIE